MNRAPKFSLILYLGFFIGYNLYWPRAWLLRISGERTGRLDDFAKQFVRESYTSNSIANTLSYLSLASCDSFMRFVATGGNLTLQLLLTNITLTFKMGQSHTGIPLIVRNI